MWWKLSGLHLFFMLNKLTISFRVVLLWHKTASPATLTSPKSQVLTSLRRVCNFSLIAKSWIEFWKSKSHIGLILGIKLTDGDTVMQFLAQNSYEGKSEWEREHSWWQNRASVRDCSGGFPYTPSHSCHRTSRRNFNSQHVSVGRSFWCTVSSCCKKIS